jgi:uncharacterized protein
MSQTQLPRGLANLGPGPRFSLIDIGHPDYAALIEADCAFWTLVPRQEAADYLVMKALPEVLEEKLGQFQREMQSLRFGLAPAAVYFNPTERCNLNCSYCYLPEEMRRSGVDMADSQILAALERLAGYFNQALPADSALPQIVFHGSEPLLRREAVFRAIEEFSDRFRFGLQTNATLLDDEALSFIRERGVSLGISLDGHLAEIHDQTRTTWGRKSCFAQVSKILGKLVSYPNHSVICTVTRANVRHLTRIVEFFHGEGVQAAMFNPVRCTRPGGLALKPDNGIMAEEFIRAMERAGELCEQTGRRLVIANFANVLVGIVAPTARRLMCDISPCGGGRCFFAVAATGDLYPCSEFLGLPEFKGGNLFEGEIESALHSAAFQRVVGRKVEDFSPCRSCAIRHFCGAPCPAEVYATAGTLLAAPPYCAFYVEQVRYAFRVIAACRLDAYLWEGWQDGIQKVFGLD